MDALVLRNRLLFLEKRYENMFAVLSDVHQQNRRREIVEVKQRYCAGVKTSNGGACDRTEADCLLYGDGDCCDIEK